MINLSRRGIFSVAALLGILLVLILALTVNALVPHGSAASLAEDPSATALVVEAPTVPPQVTVTLTATPVPPTATVTPVPPTVTVTATPEPPTATATPVPPTVTASPTPVPDILLWMKLDEQSGATSFFDAVSSRPIGSCHDRACPLAGVGGVINNAATFRGAQLIDLGRPTSVASRINNFTIAAWIKLSSPDSIGRIISTARITDQYSGFGFGIRGEGLRFTNYGLQDNDSTKIVLSLNIWYHVAVVVDSKNTVTFYVNGIAKESLLQTQSGNVNLEDSIYIGATTRQRSPSINEGFRGAIDNVTMYGHALSPQDVAALYTEQISQPR